MKSLIKKKGLFLALFVFILPYSLYAGKCISRPIEPVQNDYRAEPSPKWEPLVCGYCRAYNLPKEVYFMINRFALPKDLSNQDLSGFDFTGCQFTDTNLTDTNLENAILTNTTCDYQRAFQDNINKCEDKTWYQDKLLKDLKSITEVYPRVKNHADKVKLLHIACGLSRLPFYKDYDIEFWIKLQYWSCVLLQLKNKLGDPYSSQIVCSYELALNIDTVGYCWSTDYPQNDVDLDEKNPHARFAEYLTRFRNGLTQHNCKSKNSDCFDYYKVMFEKSILGLKEAYPKLNNKELQKEVCQIACALSKSYQIGGMRLRFHHLFYQNQLIRLKNSIGIMAKDDIYYDCLIFEEF